MRTLKVSLKGQLIFLGKKKVNLKRLIVFYLLMYFYHNKKYHQQAIKYLLGPQGIIPCKWLWWPRRQSFLPSLSGLLLSIYYVPMTVQGVGGKRHISDLEQLSSNKRAFITAGHLPQQPPPLQVLALLIDPHYCSLIKQ